MSGQKTWRSKWKICVPRKLNRHMKSVRQGHKVAIQLKVEIKILIKTAYTTQSLLLLFNFCFGTRSCIAESKSVRSATLHKGEYVSLFIFLLSVSLSVKLLHFPNSSWRRQIDINVCLPSNPVHWAFADTRARERKGEREMGEDMMHFCVFLDSQTCTYHVKY